MQANYTLNLPHYSSGPQAYDLISDVLRPYGKRVAVIGGETALAKASPTLIPALEAAGATITTTLIYGKDATNANIDAIRNNPDVQSADVIFGVGGGRACDTVKTAADLMGKPYMTCPTVASNCAPITAVAVIYKDDGSLDHYHFGKSCPDHCFVNTSVILDSPKELFWAGLGDALSKQIEVLYASRGKELFHTPLLGVHVAQACQKPLLDLGVQALEDMKAGELTNAFTECVLDIIVSTGVVSNLVTHTEYYYNSSLAHCFYNASMSLPTAHKHLHGEVVSFGNLVLLAYDGQDALLDKFLDFNQKLGLPITLKQLDIDAAGLEKLLEVAPKIKEWTCTPTPTTVEKYREAILAVDKLGTAR